MRRPCPICGSTEFKKMFACKDYFVSGETFEIIECRHCYMRVTDNFPNEKSIGKYYKTAEYISHSNTKKGIVNTCYHLVRQFMLQQKCRWVKKNTAKKSGMILDVGTGTGYFANAMKERGWNVFAIEKDDTARDFATKSFGLTVFPDISNFASQSSEKLDVITLWHVLEHIENLDESMILFDQLLKPDGTLIIAVPNCNSYDAKKYQNLWAAYDVPRHLWHFRAEQMDLLAKKHGFLIKEIKKMPFDAFYISMMSEKNAKKAFSFIRGIIVGKIAFTASLFDKKRSSSLVYVIKKQHTL